MIHIPVHTTLLLSAALFLSISLIYLVFKRIRKKLHKNNREQSIQIADSFETFAGILDQYSLMQKMLNNMMIMVDQTSGICMWMKDAKDRYLYADKSLRSLLFQGMPLKDIIGKTDSELSGMDCRMTTYEDLEEILEVLPKEKLSTIPAEIVSDGIVCNITDVITRAYKKPCRFYEEVGEKILDVWKTPVLDDAGDVCATVGSLVDVTRYRHERIDMLQSMIAAGQAFRIDSTRNFYLRRYDFGGFERHLDECVEKERGKREIFQEK